MPKESPDSTEPTEEKAPSLMDDLRTVGAEIASMPTLIDDVRALVSHVQEMRRYKRCKARAAKAGEPFLGLH